MSEHLKRICEWYLGVPSASPGQGTAWRFQFDPPWPAWLPSWLLVVLATALVATVVLVYRSDARSLSRGRRAGLVALRLAIVLLVLVFASGLSLSIDRTGLPTVLVFVDDSASAGLQDQYEDPEDAAAVEELLEETGQSEPTRLNLARGILTRDDAEFLRRLQDRHKLRVYRFSETSAPVGRTEYLERDDLDELLTHLRELEPTGPRTRPGPAVRKVLEELRGTPPVAVVVLSDGIASTSEADRLSEIAPLARSRLVPIFTVGLGSDEPARDVQVYDVLVDEVAFLDDPLSFNGKVKASGDGEQRIRVRLLEKASGRELASQTVRLPGDGRPANFELVHTPREEGKHEYVVQADALPKETNRQNNSETRAVQVREEKIRVLLVDYVPRFEFKFVKSLLERERTVELRTVLQDADLEFTGEDQTALDHFPVRKEDLFRYDVVVFGDVNPAYLSPVVLENLQAFVRDAGGGLLAVAGRFHNPVAYRGTPLEVVLPVQLSTATMPPLDGEFTDGFRPRLTVAGRKSSSVFRFADTERESLRIWNELPEIYWMVETPDLKPGGIVFAERPEPANPAGALPVISMQRFGSGKVLFHASDDFWLWRHRVGDTYYGRYWVQAIRYLSRAKLLGTQGGTELTSDRRRYDQGEDVSLRVRFVDDRLVPSDEDGVSVMVERQSGVRKQVTLSRLPQTPNVFEGRFPDVLAGSYHAWIVDPAFTEAPPATDFRVEAPDRELDRREMDRADLVETARETYGEFYTVAEAEELPEDVPEGRPVPLESREPIPLWSRPEFLLLFAGLLAAEWLLRKKYRLV